MAANTTAKSREILVILNGGRRRKVLGIPANAKITYGPVSPGSREYGGRDSNALRIYTTTNNQLAIFVGVQEFRDLSLTVQEEKVVSSGKHESERGPKGSKENVEKVTVVEWEDA